MATTKHLYPNENDGCQNFFYQIMQGYFYENEGEFHTRVHPQGIWWNSNGQEIVHVGQDALDYELDNECKMRYIIDVIFHKAGIRQ
jgi:hypothetical protein